MKSWKIAPFGHSSLTFTPVASGAMCAIEVGPSSTAPAGMRSYVESSRRSQSQPCARRVASCDADGAIAIYSIRTSPQDVFEHAAQVSNSGFKHFHGSNVIFRDAAQRMLAKV